MRLTRSVIIAASLAVLASCSPVEEAEEKAVSATPEKVGHEKAVIYQVFTRLFGNRQTPTRPWGTIEENGVGKFADFTPEALASIRELGTTHIWYTGVPHHAVVRDYTEYGISLDDPDVVKGRAGSPYAVKDYYSVNPDLALDPANRLAEFSALIGRTHAAGMKVVIDIVPNHIARGYESLDKPEGIEDFGARDDTSVAYARDNNFYYVPGEDFRVPAPENDYKPLGNGRHPLADGHFLESPAKWTGNGARSPQPNAGDWYETVKVNYGVRPDGSYDFDQLPEEYRKLDWRAHAAFWDGRDVPDSWVKFRQIAEYWLDFGVDGFRFDMAEMVPPEFWSYLNSSIKLKKADAFLLAEVYDHTKYRDYIQLGQMDYLYNKDELYDTLKAIMQGRAWTDALPVIRDMFADVEPHMLTFLENHDEQRIASPDFAGSPEKGKPAMVVSALLGTGPTMVYFGQELGEKAEDDTGFGDPTRTTIFDYWAVPTVQRWNNDGQWNEDRLTVDERALRAFYAGLLKLSNGHPALKGGFADLHLANRQQGSSYDGRVYSFARFDGGARLLVVSNFADWTGYEFDLVVGEDAVAAMGLEDGDYTVSDLLGGKFTGVLTIKGGRGTVPVRLDSLGSLVLEISASSEPTGNRGD